MHLDLGDDRGGVDGTGAPQVNGRNEARHSRSEVGQQHDGHRGQIDVAWREVQAVGESAVLGQKEAMIAHGGLGLTGAAAGEGQQGGSLRRHRFDLLPRRQGVGARPANTRRARAGR